MTTVRTRVLTLLAAVLLAGCSGSGSPGVTQSASSAAGSRSPAAIAIPAPSPSPAASAVEPGKTDYVGEADGLSLTVTLDRAVVRPGEVVTFTATLKNESTEPVDYSVPYCG